MSGQNKVRSFLLSFNDEDKYVALREEFKKLKQLDYFIAGKDDNGILIYCHFKDKYKLSKKILSYGVKMYNGRILLVHVSVLLNLNQSF